MPNTWAEKTLSMTYRSQATKNIEQTMLDIVREKKYQFMHKGKTSE